MIPDRSIATDDHPRRCAMRRKLAAGNWKMNGQTADLAEVKYLMTGHAGGGEVDVVICPPATLLAPMAALCAGHQLALGGQDCHSAASGAFTGDISAPMLRDAGADYVILGHSERRAAYGEGNETIAAKAKAAHDAGLIAIICLGESADQRQSGQTLAVVAAQLAASVPASATAQNTVIAYEPIWAIGTGLVPSLDEIAQVHGALRADLCARFAHEGAAMRILYGGSVKPSNAGDIFALPDVDGALVGGASLKASDFGAIIAALSNTAKPAG
jgi:triosephosphate isomerase